jgi:hypothetical protein
MTERVEQVRSNTQPSSRPRKNGWIADAPVASAPEVAGKWSGRRTLIFVVSTCALAWIAILAGVFYLL